MVNQANAKRRRGRNKGEDLAENSTPNSQHSTVLVTLDGEKWFDYGKRDYPDRNTVLENANPTDIVEKYRKLADTYMRQQLSGLSSDDDNYLDQTIRKGTLKDKIAALSVSVSTDPLSKFFNLDTLLEYFETPNSRVSQMAAEALEDLFLNTLLPGSRKLVSLAYRPLTKYEKKNVSVSPKLLLIWRFEEKVCEKYKLFLKTVFEQLNSNLAVQKIACIRILSNLIRSVPEQEAQILKNIVNKLGDPAKKVASAASHELRRLLEQHPAMNGIVAREVQQFIFRANNSKKALYNGAIFLNQLQLSVNDTDLASDLLKTYFKVFDLVVQADKPDDPMKSRLLSAILSGVNRAHPYLGKDDNTMKEHIDALFRISHVSPPGARTQSLLLLFQLVAADDQTKERFYRALYSTIGPEMFGSGRHLTMYFNLLYKALKHETDVSRLMAFCKRIFAISLHCNSPVAAGVIFLLNEITKEHPVLLTTYTETLSGTDSMRVLDISKREPKFALNSNGETATNAGDEKLAPGWELALMKHHFHPSVKKFANGMGGIEYSGDPLKDFALTPFLDKFAYRNPKKTSETTTKQRSVAERKSGTDKHAVLPFNDPKFLKQEKIAAEDEFFRQFFVERAKRDEAKGIVRHKDNETEMDALDKEEEQLDYQRFEDYQALWPSDDEEEEAFVDSLVQNIIEDQAVGMGVDELDDEDPDMDDWGDLNNEDEGNSASEPDASDDNNSDNASESESCSGDRSEDEHAALNDQDAFMDDDYDDSDSDAPANMDGEDDSDSDDDLAFIIYDDESSSEDDEAPQLVQLKHGGGTFASLEDYEEMIEKSWKSMKRPSETKPKTSKRQRRKR